MFKTLLVANRGEIACRVIRTARRLGIRTVAVYSDADAQALHVEQADDAVRIGPAPAPQSYLDQDAIVLAIAASGADAVHPGYGFLSENADFAQAVSATGATFVGPSADAIRAMGSKIGAKALVAEAGTPVVPGYDGADQDPQALAAQAAEIGFPVLIKASMGGGGKGMRQVDRAEDFAAALAGAKRESSAAFGDDTVLLERYLTAPKHIEIQILADTFGKTLSLLERDCSVQRRHQKVIEEAPAPTVDPALRSRMSDAAIRAARAVGYVGAGTVEFIAEGGDFYFMEMNTRLQVEHPVTEAILGLDLVEWQLKIAAGERIAFDQDDVAIDGHAVEARLYAENTRGKRFLPSTGTLQRVVFGEARVDAAIRDGTEVTVHYDPMLAKVIAHGATRTQAVARLDAALRATEIAGVEHNIAWLRNVLGHPQFASGTYTTLMAEQHADELTPAENWRLSAAGLLGHVLGQTGGDPWSRNDAFQINRAHELTIRVRSNRRTHDISVVAQPDHYEVATPAGALRFEDVDLEHGQLSARVDSERLRVRLVCVGQDVFVMANGATERLTIVEPDAGAFGRASERGGRVTAPMPGRIVSVAVAAGERVRADAVLVVLEAMKMEHSIRAPADAAVAAVHCAVGDRVDEGVELVSLESD
ncbi:MAG: ATP-grasp domain-containing protein [Gammaproteobacteria bacterium]|nr:ATP-grasp domain-containing protein [Gammaproteobacteria bacterium]